MTVIAVRTQLTTLPLSDPEWRFVRGPIRAIAGYVVELSNEQGLRGHGYFRAMPPSTAPLEALKAAFDPLAQALIGVDERSIHAALDRMDACQVGLAPLKASLECALHDLRAKSLQLPLHQIYGGMRQDSFASARIIPLKSALAMAEVAAGLVQQGFTFLKIKLSGDEALDVERVRSVRAAAGSGVRLMADANESYSPKPAIRMIGRIADLGVELIEQPTPGDDIEGLARVTRAVPILVEADESAPDVAAITRIAQSGAADSISLRLMNLGGIEATRRAIAVCDALGLNYRFGAIFGSQLMHAHTLQLAASLPAQRGFAHEFSEFALFQDDPFEGLALHQGRVGVPQGIGAGVTMRGGSAR